jgi:hypothetical protein
MVAVKRTEVLFRWTWRHKLKRLKSNLAQDRRSHYTSATDCSLMGTIIQWCLMYSRGVLRNLLRNLTTGNRQYDTVTGRLATVITNLLSAIPWIGQDFVEFVWTIYLFILLPFTTVAVLLILFLREVDPLLTI